MKEIFANGRRVQVLTNRDGFAALLDARIVGVFPTERMALEAVVQTIEQAHGPRGSQPYAA